MKTATILTFFLTFTISPTLLADNIPAEVHASAEVQATSHFNASTGALEISMQSIGKPESILVYVSRSNGTVVHFEYVTITSETTFLKIDLNEEGSGAYNLRLHGNSLQHSYAFKKSTP